MNEPQTPTPTSPQPQKKKGLSPVAWILIGCLGLMLLGGIVFMGLGVFAVKKGKEFVESSGIQDNPAKAVAEMAVRMNPDLELVESDDDAETLTIRDKRSGEVATFDWSEIGEGKFSFRGDDGEEVQFQVQGDDEQGIMTVTGGEGDQTVTFGGGSEQQIPDWVIEYPGTTPESVFHMSSGEGMHGTYTAQTEDSVAEVLSYLEVRLKSEGFELTKSQFSGPQGETASITGTTEDPERRVTYVITVQDQKTQIAVSFQTGG